MTCAHVTRTILVNFIARLDREFGRPGRLYLVGETTQVFEGWRPWSPRIEFTADVASEDRGAFSRVAEGLAEELRVSAIDEWPGDVIPLPEGYEGRARGAAGAVLRHLALYHFDPYSVAFRFMARAIDLASDVLPTPGGPENVRIVALGFLIRARTARNSRIRSLIFSSP